LPQVRYSTLTQGNEAGVLYPIHRKRTGPFLWNSGSGVDGG
jgi:hypothetical protein